MNIGPICRELRNYFTQQSDKHWGTYTIENGNINASFLIPYQYFAIFGSKLNDGVYVNDAEGLASLKDETFTGSVWDMHVPAEFIALCEDLDKFNTKVDELQLIDKGYASESWGGYSYSLSSSAPASMIMWQDRLNRSLNMWRKLNRP